MLKALEKNRASKKRKKKNHHALRLEAAGFPRPVRAAAGMILRHVAAVADGRRDHDASETAVIALKRVRGWGLAAALVLGFPYQSPHENSRQISPPPRCDRARSRSIRDAPIDALRIVARELPNPWARISH